MGPSRAGLINDGPNWQNQAQRGEAEIEIENIYIYVVMCTLGRDQPSRSLSASALGELSAPIRLKQCAASLVATAGAQRGGAPKPRRSLAPHDTGRGPLLEAAADSAYKSINHFSGRRGVSIRPCFISNSSWIRCNWRRALSMCTVVRGFSLH